MMARQTADPAPSMHDHDLGNGHLSGSWGLPRRVSAISASYKTAFYQKWAKDWPAATSGAGLRAIAKSHLGLSYSRFHA